MTVPENGGENFILDRLFALSTQTAGEIAAIRAVMEAMSRRLDGSLLEHQRLEERVAALEKAYWRGVGIVCVVAGMVTLVLNKLELIIDVIK